MNRNTAPKAVQDTPDSRKTNAGTEEQEAYNLHSTLDGYEVKEIGAKQFAAWYRSEGRGKEIAFET